MVTPAATTETESDSELESEPVADTETDKEAETELQSESVVDTDTDADADKFTSIDPAEDISEATPEADEETPDEPSDEDSDELLDESSDQLPDERIEDVDDTTSEEKVEEDVYKRQVYVNRMKRVEADLTEALTEAAAEVKEGNRLPRESANDQLAERLAIYEADGEAQFDGRYLPDPDTYFDLNALTAPDEARAISYWPSALFLLLGLFGLVGAAASLTAIPPAVPQQVLPVLILSLIHI